jgi:hypothetical protein
MIKFFRDRKIKKILKRPLKSNQKDIYQFISDLKALDVSLIQTIGYLRNRVDSSLNDAKEIVLNSPSWIGEKDRFIEFNNRMQDLMIESANKVEEMEDGQVRLTFDLTKDDK